VDKERKDENYGLSETFEYLVDEGFKKCGYRINHWH
jgi:hypothetical protein